MVGHLSHEVVIWLRDLVQGANISNKGSIFVSSFVINISNTFYNDQKMHRLGGSRFVVVGMPPIGCMPLVKNMKGATACVDSLNQVAATFNSKLKAQLSALKTTLRIKVGYGDIYNALISAIKTPTKYGKRATTTNVGHINGTG